jgi:DNA-binding transcriptional ArsR family regulator
VALVDESEVQMITDSRVIAAMTHPVRRRLLSVLKLDGPSTVSVLAQQTGQAVGSISHHLKALAGAGLVEEVPELARDRREHWWRRTTPAIRWTTKDFADDPASEAIARAAVSLNLEYQISHVRQWDASTEEEKALWPHGPFSTDTWMRLSDAELVELREELVDVMVRWEARPLPDDDVVRSPVFVFTHAVPGQP